MQNALRATAKKKLQLDDTILRWKFSPHFVIGLHGYCVIQMENLSAPSNHGYISGLYDGPCDAFSQVGLPICGVSPISCE